MRRSTVNYIVDWVSFLVMVGLIATGLLMRFILPPGSGGRGGGHGLALWNLTRHGWGDVHFWLAAAALTLLFTFTYLWVAYNRFHDVDGRGLGWFSLFVAITVTPVAINTLSGAVTVWDVWFGLSWAAWAVLWFMFFLLLAMKKPIAKVTGAVTCAEGVLTGWLPGYLLLEGILA